ncbi:sodium:proton antiporter [Parvularcula flava]|uniref:Cation transporter n=1 Tax=Aquisalinus luteolus TaxID=1566827 RepID=A0A8J3A9T9_9PROT|nr:sodium:proton antiporter [Aquisalinus luteolus]NHK29465.1 sodium:proton antiporter [Aquisalinus luteolus]GGI01862.1 cation transporter [Aquisalinus luteolus]
MDPYIICVALVGFVALSISWVKHVTSLINISYPIVFLILGIVLYLVVDELPWASPYRSQTLTMHLTELMVIVAIMGTGLRIDIPFSLKNWGAPFRLVLITMVLSIAALTALGYWGLGWGLATAVLLGAVLAPTDPVLAGDVQVGPPNSKDTPIVKFALTGEAGINDGLAFPFVWLAIGLALSAAGEDFSLLEWGAYSVVYKIAAGIVCGYLAGRLVSYLFFHLPDTHDLVHVQQGLVALSATLFVYGVTELLHGYGFIAVFVTAITIRNKEMEHEYHEKLHEFIGQIEHILLAVMLILFGGSLVDGILGSLTWPAVLTALVFLLVIRPLSGYLGMAGKNISLKEKLAIGFFGIRGIGSFFYLAFALTEVDFAYDEELWSLVAFVVLLSILGHGVTATYVMRKLKKSEGA